MKRISRIGILALSSLALAATCASAQTPSSAAPSAQKASVVTKHASGPFDVKVTPQPTSDKSETPLGRYTLDKQYHGDLEATGAGEMLTAGTPVKGSGGYVAIEKVTGTLQGHSGSFVLQHTGTMTNNQPQLSVTVVPDSGTGQLVGITGKMIINMAGGKHSYDFEYTLPETK